LIREFHLTEFGNQLISASVVKRTKLATRGSKKFNSANRQNLTAIKNKVLQ